MAIIISLASVYIDPNRIWWPALAGLAFPQLFLINLIFFLLFLIVKRKFALISLIFIVIGLGELPKHFQLSFAKAEKGDQFKILSLNVRNFDLYNWSENKKTRDRILTMINEQEADLICLQEFFNTTDPKHDFKTLDTILEFEKHYEKHVEYTATVKETEHWGIATFTSFPIVGQGRIDFEPPSNNIAIYTDVFMGRDTLRIYNVHLASVRFDPEDYNYIENVVDQNGSNDLKGSIGLMQKLKLAYQFRAEQVKLIRKHMDKSPFRIILCGDFNDTPTSFAYNKLSQGLNDTFVKSGSGLGTTYSGKLPNLRIDYIFADPYITILRHDLIRSYISDHFPIASTLEIQE